MLVSLFAIACLVGALLALDVRDWRCYPVALLYPPTVENVEYGAVGPILVLLVALGWRYRERIAVASLSVGAAIVAEGLPLAARRLAWQPRDDGRLHSALCVVACGC